MNFKLRVDGTWSDISGSILKKVEPYCEKLVLYEHPAEGDKAIHVHGLLMGWTKKEDTLRNCLKALRPIAIEKWSYELCQKQKRDGPAVDEGYIVYMSKGHIQPCLLKGWSPDYIEEQRQKWVDRKPAVIPIVERGGYKVTPATGSTAKSKKLTSEEKMTAYLVNTGWVLNKQFSLAVLEEYSVNPKLALDLLCNNVVRPAVVAYTYGRVHNQQLVAMVRNALYLFSDDNVRHVVEQTIGNSLTYV